jgi:hypothetical protein
MTEVSTCIEKVEFFNKPAINRMGESDLEKMVTYFKTRLINKDELLVEELCKTKYFEVVMSTPSMKRRIDMVGDIALVTAEKNIIDDCLRDISGWNADKDKIGLWRTIEEKRVYVDSWLNKYITQVAWGRYLNSVRVARSTGSSPKQTTAVKVTSPCAMQSHNEDIKRFSKQFEISMPEARGISTALGAHFLELFMLKDDKGEHKGLREIIKLNETNLSEAEKERSIMKLRIMMNYMVSDVTRELERIHTDDLN